MNSLRHWNSTEYLRILTLHSVLLHLLLDSIFDSPNLFDIYNIFIFRYYIHTLLKILSFQRCLRILYACLR